MEYPSFNQNIEKVLRVYAFVLRTIEGPNLNRDAVSFVVAFDLDSALPQAQQIANSIGKPTQVIIAGDIPAFELVKGMEKVLGKPIEINPPTTDKQEQKPAPLLDNLERFKASLLMAADQFIDSPADKRAVKRIVDKLTKTE